MTSLTCTSPEAEEETDAASIVLGVASPTQLPPLAHAVHDAPETLKLLRSSPAGWCAMKSFCTAQLGLPKLDEGLIEMADTPDEPCRSSGRAWAREVVAVSEVG